MRVLYISVALASLVAGCGTDPTGFDPNVNPGTGGGPGPNPEREDAGDDPDPLPPSDAGPKLDMKVDTAPPVDVAPRPDGASACNFGRIAVKTTSPDVVLVFDRSSSMRKMQTGSTQTRFNEMSDGIDDALKTSPANVAWGLKFSPTAACEVAAGLDVALGALNYSNLITRIRGTMPEAGVEGGGPVGRAIRQATTALQALPATNPKYMALVTDGAINCPAGLPGEREATSAIQAAAGMGTNTFVLGAPANADQTRILTELANAGREPSGGATPFYVAQNKTQMLMALQSITSRVTSCVFAVRTPPPAPEFVALEAAGKRVPRDPQRRNGWDWGVQYRFVHVYGPACEALRTPAPVLAELIYGCPGIAP
jgi:hypothetical protein